MSPAPALLGATSHWQMVRSQMEECRKGENGLTRVFFSPSFLHVSPSFFLYAPRARKDVWKITLAQTQGGQTDDYCPDLFKKKFRLINTFNPMLVRFTPLFTQLMWRKLVDMHLKSSSLSHTYAWLTGCVHHCCATVKERSHLQKSFRMTKTWQKAKVKMCEDKSCERIGLNK